MVIALCAPEFLFFLAFNELIGAYALRKRVKRAARPCLAEPGVGLVTRVYHCIRGLITCVYDYILGLFPRVYDYIRKLLESIFVSAQCPYMIE